VTRSTNLILAVAVGALLSASPVHAGQAANPHGGHGAPVHGQHVGALDLNNAPVDELRQIPGISEATAKKIAASRPFARTDELITKKILSKAEYDKIREHVAVTKPAK
jgi:hypothetical protein